MYSPPRGGPTTRRVPTLQVQGMVSITIPPKGLNKLKADNDWGRMSRVTKNINNTTADISKIFLSLTVLIDKLYIFKERW